MPEYLETKVDKFTFKVARDRFYTRDGIWLMSSTSAEGVVVRLGLTDYLQQHSGDVAFVNLKPTGMTLSAGDEFAEIEISGAPPTRDTSARSTFSESSWRSRKAATQALKRRNRQNNFLKK